MEQPLGYVNTIETFGAVDGPGIRFVVFLQGCAMRCLYCHNPNTWAINHKNGKTADELLDMAEDYRAYWGKKGGLTVSGGEAMLQMDFLIDYFTKAKKRGMHTALDTCGQPFTFKEPFFSKFNQLMAVTDLVILDIKHIDNEVHKKLTGWPNTSILACARYLSDLHKPMWIRHVLVPGWTDDDEALKRLDAFISTLNAVERVEILPYHTLGVLKYAELKIQYALEGVQPPTTDRIENANRLLHTDQYTAWKEELKDRS